MVNQLHMRTLFTSILTLLAVCMGFANPIDLQQARQLASQFMQSHGAIINGEPKRAPGLKASNTSPLYIFNTENNKGFVIVAGDDRAETILGYTEQGDNGCV